MGSHAADELSARGYAVSSFDRIQSPYLSSNQTMITGDMMDESVLESAFSGMDYIYYFAGVADIGEAKEKPYETINSNVMGVTLALKVAVASRSKGLSMLLQCTCTAHMAHF